MEFKFGCESIALQTYREFGVVMIKQALRHISNAATGLSLLLLFNLCVLMQQAANAAKPADFDGDGNSDLAVWRPSDGNWYVATRSSAGSPPVCPPCFTYFGYGGCVRQWGLPGDTPRPADFDGDGKVDVAVWRPTVRTWFILPSATCGPPFTIDLSAAIISTDLPDAADMDGDGKADIMMMRRNPINNAYWYVRNSSSGAGAFYSAFEPNFLNPLQAPFATVSGQYASTSPTPRATRYERYGVTGGVWIKTRLAGPFTDYFAIPGQSGASVVPGRGDFGGSAANLLDYIRLDTASNGNWIVFPNGGGQPLTLPSWGLAGDKAISGDYNADGLADLAVWRPSSGTFFVNIPATPCPAGMSPTEPVPPFPPPQSAHPGCFQQWGLSSDIPIESMVDISLNYN